MLTPGEPVPPAVRIDPANDRKESTVPESTDMVMSAIEAETPEGLSRRSFVKGATLTLGGGVLGLMALPEAAFASNDPQTILNVAASA
jgi:hypothetical protein